MIQLTAGTCRGSPGYLTAATSEQYWPEMDGRAVSSSQIILRRGENIMREGIHPNYYQTTVTCNCGNTFVTGSTKKEIHVEVCSKCHSFYTGQQKTMAARGRIDKFNKKYGIK